MGGIETHCQSIYTGIARATQDLEIIVLARRPYVGQHDYEHYGVKIRPIWTVKNKLFETILHTFLSVLQARFRERADVIHFHAIGPGLLAPLARGLGMKVVATHHGHDYKRLKWGPFAKIVLRFSELCMVAAADQVICVSEASAVSLRAAYPNHADKIGFIPNGATIAEETASRPEILAELGVSRGQYILAVGRLVPEKGFQDLIAAVNRVEETSPLVIVGGADHAGTFSDMLRQQASERVIFAGSRRHEELAALYRNAGLFVLPSYHEGHPIAALEALCAGAPILLSDIEPNREFGFPAVNYFPVGNVNALAERLSGMSFEALRVDYSALASRYDWANIVERTEYILRTVVNGAKA